MSIKVYGVNFKDVRLSKDLDIANGPGFFINTVRTFENFYPAFGDWSSSSTLRFSVNMGQEPFNGNPQGFSPYDPDYNDSNWFGTGSTNSGTITPDNTELMFYDKRYTSGKYYMEFECISPSVAFVGMHNGASSNTSSVREDAVGVGIREIDTVYTWIGPAGDPADYGWSSAPDIGMGVSDTYQVWVDFDNQKMCVKKLGTTIDDYQNYIEL